MSKTKIMWCVTITIIAFAGAVTFYSCQKEETLTTKTEEITSIKEQKLPPGYESVVAKSMTVYQNGKWVTLVVNTRVWYSTQSGCYIYYDSDGNIIRIPSPPGAPLGYDPPLLPPYSNPPYFPPTGYGNRFNFKANIKDEILPQLRPGEDNSLILSDFVNYDIYINNELVRDNSTHGLICVDEEGEFEFIMNYTFIKEELWPKYIGKYLE